MSEQHGPKNYDATPARKQKAKREGNSARSSELAGIAGFGCALIGAVVVVPVAGAQAAAALHALAVRPTADSAAGPLVALAACALVPAALAGAGAAVAGLLQGGGLTVTPPKWQLSRLHPGSGLKRMVSFESLTGVARALAAFGAVSLALWPLCAELIARSTTLAEPGAFGALAFDAMRRACWAAIAGGLVFALADYGLVRRRWLRDLKMTFEEMRRDQKENDGDPNARARRKALHRSFARGAIARTKEASFVVVNPTHIAIAVRYVPPEVPVPEILVRAVDEGALRVKQLAREYGIPVVENVALARALFAQGEAGRAIPSGTFVAVARVIAELMRAGVLA